MEGIFLEITLIVTLAAGLTYVFRLLKQPAILAYILTGVLLGPIGLFHIDNPEALMALGEVGIMLLLFMMGLELRLPELKSIGKIAIIGGTAQMVITLLLGMGLGLLLGLSTTISLYIGIALAFSSTVIVVKMLSDKKDLNSLHGKIAIGFLLMQDFFAVLTIIFLQGPQGTDVLPLPMHVALLVVKVALLFGAVFYLSMYVLPKITKRIAQSEESFFLFSLAWVFLLTAVVSSPWVGFSKEVGGFLAGLALANSTENFQILSRMRSLRDFFLTIFFVVLGFEMKFVSLTSIIFPTVVLTAFVLIVKPFIIMVITSLLGYRKRTSFLVGSSLAQVSEFSFIILFIANSSGSVPSELVTTMLLVGVITFTASTYFMQKSNYIYLRVHKYISFLDKGGMKRERLLRSHETYEDMDDHIILIGGHQMGESIMHSLKGSDEKILVVDFDPDVVSRLKEKGLPVFFGDISDAEIQERAGIERAKIVISTVSDVEDNLTLIQALEHVNKKAKVIVLAFEGEQAKELYKAGADYVIMPHLVGGHHLAKLLIDKNHLELIEKYKEKDMSYIS